MDQSIKPLHKLLANRHLHLQNNKQQMNQFKDSLKRKQYIQLYQREFTLPYCIDKIFSSLWISPQEILVGTKDNKLLVLNAINGSSLQVVLPDTGCFEGRGIYSISLNPSKTLIAIATGQTPKGFTIQVYHFNSFIHKASLIEHTDIIFKVCWIDDSKLVSASRDTTFRLWDLEKDQSELTDSKSMDFEGSTNSTEQQPLTPNSESYKSFTNPVDAVKIDSVSCGHEHYGKVRDCTLPSKSNSTASLSSDGSVKEWDIETFQSKSSYDLTYTTELITLESDQSNLLFVGSRNHITKIDTRSKEETSFIPSLNDGWGVRCMHVSANILTIGGGIGRLAFYDLRASKYLNLPKATQKTTFKDLPPLYSGHCEDVDYHETGKGSVQRTFSYDAFYSNQPIKQGICTLGYSWDESKLFTGGGPLQLSLSGSFAAVW